MSKKKSRSERAQEEAQPSVVEEQSQTPAEKGQVARPLKNKIYREELAKLQLEMFKLQERVQSDGSRLVVLFEGPGPGGKKGTIQTIAEGLHRKVVRVVEPGPLSERERGQWLFQRYVEQFPAAGKITLFDGSWYHYAVAERAQGLRSDRDFRDFLRSCADFEQTLVHSGIILVKYWFAASPEQQEQRFREHLAVLSKRRKATETAPKLDAPAVVAQIQEIVFECTDKPAAPWYLVQADDKRRARLNCMRHLLNLIADGGAEPVEAEPPEPEQAEGASPASQDRRVPEVY